MTVISMVEAARLAKVTRQAIHALRKAHIETRRSYPFFCIDPVSKRPGINIDSPEWKSYIKRNLFNPCKKTGEKPRKTAQEPGGSTVEAFINLLRIMERAIKEVMEPTRKELRSIKKLCMEIYQEDTKNE